MVVLIYCYLDLTAIGVICYCSFIADFCFSFSRYKALTVFYYQNAFNNFLVNTSNA